MRAHVFVSLLFVISRVALDLAGLEFSFALDWMWLSDPADLRDRLIETLIYFHAFPPGINLLTGVLLKVGGSSAAAVSHHLFSALGLALTNVIYALARASGLSSRGAIGLALAFSLTPASIYFEHLYHYDWVVTTLLAAAGLLFFRAVRQSSTGVWLAYFAVLAVIGLTRSTFHLMWFVIMVGLGLGFGGPGARRVIFTAASMPAVLLVSLYAKNFVIFGEFVASTFGPAAYTMVTVARLPPDVRDAWVAEGRLSPFATISVYAPPREYARFFDTPERLGWPPQVTRLEHTAVDEPNFNH